MKKLFLIHLLIFISMLNAQVTWEKIFEKKNIANVRAMFTNDMNEILAIPNGSIHSYISTDEGDSWTPYYITEDPIYIKNISADNNYIVFIGYDNKIHFSSDFGRTWSKLTAFNSFSNPQRCHIKDSTYIFMTNGHDGLYRYDIAENTLKLIDNGLPVVWVEWIYFNKFEELFCQLGDERIFVSYDFGDTWQERSTKPYREIFAELELNGSGLVVSSFDRMFVTTDAGISWSRISENFNPNGNIYWLEKVGDRFFCATRSVLYSSTDFGESWEIVRSYNECKDLIITEDENIYISDGINGIYHSSDAGNSWEFKLLESNSLVGTYSVKVHDELGLFIGTRNRGVFRITNEGEEKYLGLQGNDGISRQINFDSEDNIYFRQNIIYFSSDTGNSWVARSPKQSPLRYETVKEFFIEEDTDRLLAGCAYGPLAASYDEGLSWVYLYLFGYSPDVEAIYSSANDFMLVGIDLSWGYDHFSRFYKTYNNVQWYKKLDHRITILERFNESYFVAADEGAKKIYHSSNYGDSWSYTTHNFKPQCFMPGNSSEIYAGTNDGIYVSYDSAQSWEQFSVPGLISPTVYDLDQYPDGRIVAATGDGVYRSTQPVFTTVENGQIIDLDFHLSQNYPNPFNPTTKIGFVIPSGVEGLSTLKIYDLLGREVAILVNEPMSAGTYEVEFDGSDLSSGVYLYKLTAGEFSDTKKFILMK